MKNTLRTLFILLAFAAFRLGAEVYWLDSGSGSPADGRSGAAAAQNLLEVPAVHKENLNYNGVDLVMEVGSAPWPYAEMLRLLRAASPQALRVDANGLRFDMALRNGWVRRYLLSNAGDFPALVFHIDLSPRLPKRADWPGSLPLPSGSTPVAVIGYPDRGALYGSFITSAGREQALAEMASELRTSGWRAVSGELDGRHPQGEIFLLENPPSILWIGVDASGNGIVYRRRQGSIR